MPMLCESANPGRFPFQQQPFNVSTAARTPLNHAADFTTGPQHTPASTTGLSCPGASSSEKLYTDSFRKAIPAAYT